MTESSPIFVVLGRDAQGKPHASRFADADAELASKAADLMGYHVVRVEETELKGLAANLPLGKVYATGKAFVPFVKGEVFDRLASLVENGSGGTAAATAVTTSCSRAASASGAKPSLFGAGGALSAEQLGGGRGGQPGAGL